MYTTHTIRIRYDDAIQPNTNRLFGPLFSTEANTNRIFGTSLVESVVKWYSCLITNLRCWFSSVFSGSSLYLLHVGVVKADGRWNSGWPPSGKTWKSGEFDIGQGKIREIRKSQGNCGLHVVCYLSCDSHKINITWVLLSKVDVQKMDFQCQ